MVTGRELVLGLGKVERAAVGLSRTGNHVDNERDDRRISIEGVRGCPQSAEAAEAFEDMFYKADEFNISEDEFYCWYD